MRATVEVAHEALIQRWPTLRGLGPREPREKCGRGRRSCAGRRNGRRTARARSSCSIGASSSSVAVLCSNPGRCRGRRHPGYVAARSRDQRRLDAEREADLADQKRIADAERQHAKPRE